MFSPSKVSEIIFAWFLMTVVTNRATDWKAREHEGGIEAFCNYVKGIPGICTCTHSTGNEAVDRTGHRSCNLAEATERMSDNNNLIGSIGKAVLKAAKSLGQTLVIYESPVCYQCRKPVHPDFEFCSEACTLEYWKKCRDRYHEVSGDLANGFPIIITVV